MRPTGVLLLADGMPPEELRFSLLLIAGCVILMVLIFGAMILSEPKVRRKASTGLLIGSLIGGGVVLGLFLLSAWWLLS